MIDSQFGGRYTIKTKLGEGGMGAAYLAHDQRLDSPVVIKVPHRNMLHEPGFKERFQREIRSLVRLTHPHIVSVLDVGEHGELPYSVMQYLGGGSLSEFRPKVLALKAAGRVDSLKHWLPSIATALDFIHSRGYIHRDIKPANILFDEFGHAFLSDFGIAKVVAQTEEEKRQLSLTGTGIAMGTPEFMAPELCDGVAITERVDQYALAVTVYEMLAGKCPLVGATPLATVVMHKTHTAVPLDKVVPGISRVVAQAIERAMAKDPSQRFPNCAAFSRAILDATAGGQSSPARSGSSESRSSTAKDSSAKMPDRKPLPPQPRPAPPVNSERFRKLPSKDSGEASLGPEGSGPKGLGDPSIEMIAPQGLEEFTPLAPRVPNPANPVSPAQPQIRSPYPPGSNVGPGPNANIVMAVDPELAKRQGNCPHCNASIAIPEHWSKDVIHLNCPACRRLIVFDRRQGSMQQESAAARPTPRPIRQRFHWLGLLLTLAAFGKCLCVFMMLMYEIVVQLEMLPRHSFIEQVVMPIALLVVLGLVCLERLLLILWTNSCWSDVPTRYRALHPYLIGTLLLIPILSGLWVFYALVGYSINLRRMYRDGNVRGTAPFTGIFVGILFGLLTLGSWTTLAILLFLIGDQPPGVFNFYATGQMGLTVAHGLLLALWAMFSRGGRMYAEQNLRPEVFV